MKLKRIWLLLVCGALLLSGCASRPTSFTRASKVNVKVDRPAEYVFSFYIERYDLRRDLPVTLTGMGGTNTDEIQYDMTDVTLPGIQEHKVDKGYFGQYLVMCTANEDNISIDKLFLKIGEEDVTVELPEPVTVERIAPEGGELVFTAYPGVIITISLELGQVYPYNFTPSEDVLLTGVQPSGLLNLKNAAIRKDGVTIATLERGLPVELKKGEKYTLFTAFDIDPGVAGEVTYYDTFNTTIVFQYARMEEPDKILHYPLGLEANGLMNEELIDEYIDAVMEKQKDAA